MHDTVIFNDEYGVVENIFYQNTTKARDYSCDETGGILFNIPGGLGLVVVPGDRMDEDIRFVARVTV